MFAYLLFVAAAAAAQDNGPPVIVEGTKPVEEKKVCRTVRETGSRMVKQVCKTPSQQRQDEQEAKNKLGMGNRTNRPTETFKAPSGQ